jgi:hypothetical protein
MIKIKKAATAYPLDVNANGNATASAKRKLLIGAPINPEIMLSEICNRAFARSKWDLSKSLGIIACDVVSIVTSQIPERKIKR